jgi:hypothetical protein
MGISQGLRLWVASVSLVCKSLELIRLFIKGRQTCPDGNMHGQWRRAYLAQPKVWARKIRPQASLILTGKKWDRTKSSSTIPVDFGF